jgi:electron transfer flavoprotein alpha/beta subunit
MAVPEYDLVICGAGMNDGIAEGMGAKLAGCLGIVFIRKIHKI